MDGRLNSLIGFINQGGGYQHLMGLSEVDMTPPSTVRGEQQKLLKKDEKAHEAQAKADKLQRKALKTGKSKKAEKAQAKADKKTNEAMSASGEIS